MIPTVKNQNLGNSLGSRPVIRQSKYFRQYESGNETKSLLGQNSLIWRTDEVQGVFKGSTFDADHPRGHLNSTTTQSPDRLPDVHRGVAPSFPFSSSFSSYRNSPSATANAPDEAVDGSLISVGQLRASTRQDSELRFSLALQSADRVVSKTGPPNAARLHAPLSVLATTTPVQPQQQQQQRQQQGQQHTFVREQQHKQEPAALHSASRPQIGGSKSSASRWTTSNSQYGQF